MRILRTILLISCPLLALAMPSKSHAMIAPPARIIDQKISHPCVALQKSFLEGQPGGTGTGSKGPALAIKNGCSSNIIISDVLTSKTDEGTRTLVPPMTVFLERDKEYSKGLMTGDGTDCETLSSFKEKEAVVNCKSILIPPNGTLTMPMPWATYFKITGWIGTSKKGPTRETGLSLEGEMINPDDPVEMAKLAERGDAKARQNLGMYYIRQKKFKEGLSVLTEGADKGEVESEVQLAQCYTDKCSGFDENKEEAYFWWALAAENSKEYMEYERDFAKRQLNPEQLSKVQQRLADWKKLHPPLPAKAKP